MADETPRLRDYGLQSERLLWPTKGPSRFEEEMGAAELAFFVLILFVAYVYIWRKGALNW